MSSQDFPGPSWHDAGPSDDRRSSRRHASDDGYGRPGSNQYGYDAPPPTNGGAGYSRSPSAPRGNGYDRANDGRSDYRGNGRSYPNGGRDADYGNGYPPRAAGGRHGSRGASEADPGRAPLEDSGVWYRMADRATAGYRTAARRMSEMTRRSARHDGYSPDDEISSLRERTARYGAGPYEPDRLGGSPGRRAPGAPSRYAGRRPGRRGDKRDPRGFYLPDGTPATGMQKVLRRLWYGRWWRHWSFKKVGLLFGGMAATLALALVASFLIVLNATRVPILALSEPLTQSSLVTFSNGKEIGCFCTAGRSVLSEHRIKQSKLLWEAVLAAEDRAFFTEGGISITGLARAIKNDLSGGSIQGGSTITEQFVKTYYNPNGGRILSYGTKIKEIFVAIKLAKMEPKWWILTHYLNAIPLGSGANGVQAAAETYFHRSAWQLTLAQSAMIAAMIQSPYGYQPTDPRSNATGLNNTLLDRWVYVLGNMVRDNAITQAQFNQLVPDPSNPNSDANFKNFPQVKINSIDSSWTGWRGYIMNLVVDEMQAYYPSLRGYTAAQIGNLGLRIRTTINEQYMKDLYATVAAEKRQMAAAGVRLPSYVHISAVLEKPGTGRILAFYGGPGIGVKHCSWYHCQVNTILSGEPVGSSFKPYVLTTAVSQGMNVKSSVMDSHAPICIPPDYTWADRITLAKSEPQSRCDVLAGWWPFTETSENTRQNLNPVQATAVSNDPAFEVLIHRTTVQKVIDMAKTLGVSPYDVKGLNSLFGDGCLKYNKNCHPGAQNAALGEGSLSAVDQANTMSVLVSGGRLVTPHIIDYVIQNGERVPNTLTHNYHALKPAVAADADYALSFDTSCLAGAGCGTGVPNAVWNRPMIAKTGTLGSGAFASQAWFLGAIPQYSLAIGMFTDHPLDKSGNPNQILDVLPSVGGVTGGYGGAWPAWTWHEFMNTYFNNIPVRPLPTPNFIGFKKWVMAPKVKPKKHRCQQGSHHHHWFFGGPGSGQCQGNGNGNGHGTPSPHPTSPSPHPTSPSPHPTPSQSSSPSVSPTPSHSTAAMKVAMQAVQPPHGRRAPTPAIAATSLVAVAVLPTKSVRRSGLLRT